MTLNSSTSDCKLLTVIKVALPLVGLCLEIGVNMRFCNCHILELLSSQNNNNAPSLCFMDEYNLSEVSGNRVVG